MEAAYSTDKGLTGKIVLEKGAFRLTVDENGDGLLTGKAGRVSFIGSPVLEKIGATVRRVTIVFDNDGNNRVRYRASFKIGPATTAVTGDFDPKAFVLSCSGLLCKAARAMKYRHRGYDAELQNIMGH